MQELEDGRGLVIAPAPSPQRSVARQEPAREEEVDSPGPLSLAIGKGKEIFTISD